MGRADYYRHHDWNAICDVCGQKYKASELKKRWDGLWCCPFDWEIRQPQDFVRGVKDNPTPPWTRPDNPDTFIPVCTTSTAIAGYAIAGCAIAGNSSPPGYLGPAY